MNYNEKRAYTGQPEYDKNFWNTMRGKPFSTTNIVDGRSIATGTYALPNAAGSQYMAALTEESLFRQLGTTVLAYDSGYNIFARDCNDLAQWVPESGSIPIYDGINDFTRYPVGSYKLGVFVKLDEDFVHDATFDIESYLVQRLAKNFGGAEDAAFLSGTGGAVSITPALRRYP